MNSAELTERQQAALRNITIEELNDMQCAAITHCRKNNSMILLSPTGTGKTLAYLLPLIERLDAAKSGVQAVIVSPTRELAKQIAEVWRTMSAGYRMATLHGGRPMSVEETVLKNTVPTVITGTPGRIIDHLSHGNISVEECSILIIDEFDKCLEMGFREEMQQLTEFLPSVKTRMLISATDSDEIPQFAGSYTGTRLDYRTLQEVPSERTNFYKITTTPDTRLQSLFALLCDIGSEPTIVFCNFRETVDEVKNFLAGCKLKVTSYHGALEQREREFALYSFASGCSNILISTDLAARGIDIKGVKHIVHFQRPLSKEIFTHRNGRTARWEAGGAVYTLAYPEHSLPEFMPQNPEEYHMSQKITLPRPPALKAIYIGKGKRDKISRGDIAGFLMKKGNLRPQELGKIMIFDRHAYAAVHRDKVQQLLKLVAGEKIKGIKTIIEPIHE